METENNSSAPQSQERETGDDTQKKVKTARPLGASALPPIVEWGPAQNRKETFADAERPRRIERI